MESGASLTKTHKNNNEKIIMRPKVDLTPYYDSGEVYSIFSRGVTVKVNVDGDSFLYYEIIIVILTFILVLNEQLDKISIGVLRNII